jgi:hypothetical protein
LRCDAVSTNGGRHIRRIGPKPGRPARAAAPRSAAENAAAEAALPGFAAAASALPDI